MENGKLVRAYIVDDDPSAIALLKRLLADYSVEVVGATTSTEQAVDDIVQMQPDLLFLDVEMPTLSGLDFCSQIRQWTSPEMKVVFYTGHDKYLLEALRRQAFDYMLKPANPTELAKIMTRYYENRLSTLRQSGRSGQATPLVMMVNAAGEHTTLRFDEIAFFRFNTLRRLWEVVDMNGNCNLLRHRTTADIILNYSPDFVQIHKRYIVNINKIQKVLDNQCQLCPPLDHVDELKISKNYRRDFMSTFYAM